MAHRREVQRLVVALAALVTVAMVASPAGGVTKKVGAWKVTGITVPVAAGWTSLSCPTSTTCLGVAYTDTNSLILERSVNGGASFSYAPPPSPSIYDVACGTGRFCVLAGEYEGVGAPASSYVTTNGGSSWTEVALPGSAPTSLYEVSVSCSASTCYLVGSGTSAPLFLSITASARAWSRATIPSTPDPVGSLSAVGCGGGRCVAVGSNAGYTTGLLLESDGGGPWVETLAPVESPTIAGFSSVGCSAYACAAFGAGADGAAGFLLSSTSAGAWQGTAASGLLTARSISCTSSNCVAVGGNWDVGGLAGWTLTGVTPTWNSLTVPVGEAGQVFTAASCPTTSTCIVGANRLYDLTVGDSTWSDPDVLDGTSGFVSMSCPSATTCVASVQLGDGRVATRTSVDAGRLWGPAVPLQATDGFPYGLDCVGTTCAADGYDEATNVGWVARSTDDGRRWTVAADPVLSAQSALLTAISCSTALICTAASGYGFGTFARTTNGGASWSQVTVSTPPSSNKFGITLQCMNAHLCLAVRPTQSGVMRLTSHNAGASWSYGLATSIRLSDGSLSCVSNGTCVLSGVTNTSHLAVVLRSTNGGGSWTRVVSPHETYAGQIAGTSSSCWTSTSCEVAFSSPTSSEFFTTSDGGRTWTMVPTLHGVSVVAISCSTTTCAGLGSSGADPTTMREMNP
jgi:hypothetical protein